MHVYVSVCGFVCQVTAGDVAVLWCVRAITCMAAHVYALSDGEGLRGMEGRYHSCSYTRVCVRDGGGYLY